MEWDIFISHASEDKATAVLPLASALRDRGVRVWYDEWVLRVGDSLREKIDEGLAKSTFGALVLSHSFFAMGKMWPHAELDGLIQKEVGGRKAILPVWHGVTADEVRAYSLMLAGRRAGSTAAGIDVLADELVRAMGVGSPLLTDKCAASSEVGIRLGRVVLSGIYVETDPQTYVGPQLTKRQSTHHTIGGGITIQDFGVTPSDTRVRLRSGAQKLDTPSMQKLSDLYQARGAAYEVCDWLGNEYVAFISSFVPRSSDALWWDYEMELIVTKLIKFHGKLYQYQRRPAGGAAV